MLASDWLGRGYDHIWSGPEMSINSLLTPLEFRKDLDIHKKTKMNGLSCGEESMTICSAVLIQYQRVTDR